MKKTILTLFLLLLTLSLFTGCSKVDDATILSAHQAVSNGAVIIDVRSPKEYKGKHVQNAINIPVEEIVKSVARVPKNRTLVVYCRSGSRSSHAASILRKKGWQVIDVTTQGEYERKIEIKPAS